MLNEETWKGKWNEIKGEIRTKWGKMTDDELEQSKGNSTSIIGLIQQRYGAKKEEVEGALEKIVSRFSKKSEDIKENLRRDNEDSAQL
jgi:uncharacterized protein YjbJ (UPF0337 family)